MDQMASAPAQGSPEWHEQRKTGIGGSDAAAVLGISPWRTPYQVYVEKTDPTFEPRKSTDIMRWGILQEPLLRSEYTLQTGREIIASPPLIRHPKYEWMYASLDGIADGDRLVELKTSRYAEGWGEPGTDEVPFHYGIQVHHYLAVTGLPVADVAVLLFGSDFRIYHIEADKELAEQIIEQEAKFWDMVQRREPPPLSTVDDATLRWGSLNRPGTFTAPDGASGVIVDLLNIKEDAKALKAREDELQLKLFAMFGENGDTMTDASGRVMATWKLGKESTYTVTRKAARRLLLKGMNSNE